MCRTLLLTCCASSILLNPPVETTVWQLGSVRQLSQARTDMKVKGVLAAAVQGTTTKQSSQ